MKVETVEIQNNAGVQAIVLPENFNISDNKVYLKKVGDIIYIIPFHNPWAGLPEAIGNFPPDFMEERNQPADQQRRETFD